MNETDVREQNLYIQMESLNQRVLRIYEEVVGESQTPAIKETIDKFPHGTEKETQTSAQHKNTCSQSQEVVIKRLAFRLKTATLIAFLVAVAALVLAIIPMVTRDNQSPSKDRAGAGGKSNYQS